MIHPRDNHTVCLDAGLHQNLRVKHTQVKVSLSYHMTRGYQDIECVWITQNQSNGSEGGRICGRNYSIYLTDIPVHTCSVSPVSYTYPDYFTNNTYIPVKLTCQLYISVVFTCQLYYTCRVSPDSYTHLKSFTCQSYTPVEFHLTVIQTCKISPDSSTHVEFHQTVIPVEFHMAVLHTHRVSSDSYTHL